MNVWWLCTGGLALAACQPGTNSAIVHQTSQPSDYATPAAPQPSEARDDADVRDSSSDNEDNTSAATNTAKPPSLSVGSPTAGSIEHAARIPAQGPGFIHNPQRPNEQAAYGSDEMIDALVQAAAFVEQKKPGSQLFINDLGLEKGGPIFHHGSHQNGRDVDVLFFLNDKQGKAIAPVGTPLDKKGRGWVFHDWLDAKDDVQVFFDARRTWLFIQGVIQASGNQLQRIFVVEHLRTLLLEEAARVKAPKAVIERAGHLMCQPSVPHDDHLHLRFFCSPEDLQGGCEDGTPMYPWRKQELAKLGLKPVMASRKAKPSRTVSRAEARRNAGKLHPRVSAFLDLRESWSKLPHPGRPWCR